MENLIFINKYIQSNFLIPHVKRIFKEGEVTGVFNCQKTDFYIL